MSLVTSPHCLRCRQDCVPIANISADEEGGSFICVGYNRPEDRTVPGDRFTLCWKNNVVDERGHWDRRDLLDTVSVIGQALSTDENIRVSNDFSEDQMNEQQPDIEMPRYQSHKVVHALKIHDVEIHGDKTATIAPADEGFAPFRTRTGWADRFNGGEGDLGYYVVYSGGFTSWSPAEAFESGYTRI